MKRAFTLLELMVVMLIVAIALVIVQFSLVRLLSSRKQLQATRILESSLSQSRSIAMLHGTTAGVKIERSFRTDGEGLMVKFDGKAIWNNYQQIKFVIFGHKQNSNLICGKIDSFNRIPETISFRRLIGTETIEFPNQFWIAPNFALDRLNEINVDWQPSNINAVSFNPFENFFIVFNEKGELRRHRSSFFYLDETQPYNNSGERTIPAINQMTNVARYAIIYDKTQFDEAYNQKRVLEDSSTVYCSRIGTVVK